MVRVATANLTQRFRYAEVSSEGASGAWPAPSAPATMRAQAAPTPIVLASPRASDADKENGPPAKRQVGTSLASPPAKRRESSYEVHGAHGEQPSLLAAAPTPRSSGTPCTATQESATPPSAASTPSRWSQVRLVVGY